MDRQLGAHRHTRRALAALAAVGCLLAACGSDDADGTGDAGSEPTATDGSGGTSGAPADDLTIATGIVFPNTFDPKIELTDSKFFLELVFDFLVNTTPEGEFTADGAVAEDWEVSPDNTVFTFHLRPDQTFSNGEALTAEDVKFSLDRIVEGGSSTSSPFFKSAFQSVETPDDATVVITTNSPQPTLLHFLSRRNESSEGAIVPKDYVEEVGDDAFATAPIGSGAYEVAAFHPGDVIELDAAADEHPGWGPLPARHITIRSVSEFQTRRNMLEAGEADLIDVPVLNSAELEGSYEIYEKSGIWTPTVHFQESWRDGPLHDARVRKALALAVDKQAILDSVYAGRGELEGNHGTPESLGYDEDLEPYPYDPDEARALLEEAGYPDGFEIPFYSFVQSPIGTTLVQEAIADMWADIGVTANIVPLDYGAFQTQWRAEELGPSAAVVSHPKKYSELPLFLNLHHSDGGIHINEDPAYDELLDAAAAATTEEEFDELYQDVEAYNYEQVFEFTLARVSVVFAAGDRVTEWEPGTLPQSFDLDTMSLAG